LTKNHKTGREQHAYCNEHNEPDLNRLLGSCQDNRYQLPVIIIILRGNCFYPKIGKF